MDSTGRDERTVTLVKRKVLREDGERTFALVLDEGEEASRCLHDFAEYHGLRAGRFTAVGAFSKVKLGFYDLDRKEYEPIEVNEQVEVLSFVGDIAVRDGDPLVHAHVVVGLRDGRTRGGHLLEGYVRPTLEVMVIESPAEMRRRMDEDSGLPLIDLAAT